MKNFVNKHGNERFFDGDVKELFGLPRKAKWPDAGIETRFIQDIKCWVNSRYKGDKFRLRAMCICDSCGRIVAIGRLAQHNKVHK